MLDHITLSVTDLDLAVRFYSAAFAPLGYGLQMEFNEYRGFGPKGKPSFWVKRATTPTQPMHLAFVAPSRKHVDAFFAAAIAAGARDDGAPGVRADYHPNYYAAFVVDPLGHPIEAVCHAPVAAPKKVVKKKVAAKKKAQRKARR